jgi:uncharacterized membrane protein YidH (DUF202 family)
MLDLILLVVFSITLHKLAIRKGEKPGKWVMRLVLSYLALSLIIVAICMFFMGTDAFTSPEKLKQLVPYLTISFAGQIGIFLILRYKLTGMDDVEYYDEDTRDNEPPKKDFSYFR